VSHIPWHTVHFMPVISLACNAACSYCFGPNTGKTITPEIANGITAFMKKIIGETGQKKIKVTFHGGEPLMADVSLWEQFLSGITNAFPDEKPDFNVQTNLWNLNDDFCLLFNEYKISIGTSLDGPEEINDTQRGKGYFRNTMRGIRLAEKYGLKPGCICTFTPDTVGKYREIFKFFVNNHLSFSIHGSLQAINGNKSKYVLEPEEYGKLLCNLLDLYIKYRHYIQISTLDQMIIAMTEQEGQVCTFKDCLGMFLAIDPNGEIYPCQRFCGFSEYSMGNVMANPSLESITNSSIARRFIRRQEEIKNKCAGCEHYTYCKGGCAYNSWTTGTNPDPYCESYKMIFGKIKNQLIKEMGSEENIRAVTEKPVLNRDGYHLLRKGALSELSHPESHPAKITANAIRIISYVELAANPSIKKVVEVLNRSGLQVTNEYMSELKKKLTSLNNNLNNLYIHITFQCQLNCSHCYATDNKEAGYFMTVGNIIRLVSEAHEVKFRQVVFTGGEPLLHPRLFNLLKQLGKLRRDVEPMSLVLRSNFVKQLSQVELAKIARAFSRIVVSVDGTKENHDKRRGQGTYDATVLNMEKYQEMCERIPDSAELSLCCTLSGKETDNDMVYSLNRLANRLNISKIRFKPVLPIGRAENWDIPQLSETICSFHNADDMLAKGLNPVSSCGLGQNLYVEPEGNAFPCYVYHTPHSYLGNTIRQGLMTVLDSEKFLDLRKHNVDSNMKCRYCKYRYLCGGACRAFVRGKTMDDLDAPPSDCKELYKNAEEIYLKAIYYLESNNLINKQLIHSPQ